MPSPAEVTPGLVWVPELADPGRRLTLDDEASRYVARVCRARAGEQVQLTDGAGGWAATRVLETRPHVTLEIERVERSPRTRRARLLCGAPEGERADWMVEKLAELGVDELQPVDCERAAWDRFEQRRERWERLAVAALRQSRSRFRMVIHVPRPVAAALEALPAGHVGFLAAVDGLPAWEKPVARGGQVAGAVGPSRGFSAPERATFESLGWSRIALAGNRLRTETAALAWAAWWAGGATASERPSDFDPEA